MLGCSSCAMSCASRMNRSARFGSGERSRSSTLIATSRPSDASRQRKTAANPPSPSSGPTVNSSPTALWRRWCKTAMSMADGKRRNARRAALGIVALGAAWLLGVWPPPLWWRDHTPRCTALRKLREAVTAVRLELALPKDRLLELYLNTAEWGPGIWGVEAASETYFGVPASRLTAEPAAALAATLPFPRSSNPVFQPSRMAARRELLLARYYGADVIVPPELEE